MVDWAESQPRGVAQVLKLEEFSVGKFNGLLDWLGVRGCRFVRVATANMHGSFFADSTAGSNSSIIACSSHITVTQNQSVTVKR